MSTDTAKENWTELKGKIKAKWGKLMDTDIDAFKDNMQLVAQKVQTVYGITKDKADQEYTEFKKSLEAAKPTSAEKVNPN